MAKNTLTIRLTESVVFLRPGDVGRRLGANDEREHPSMIRGLLVLNVIKPTKISSIEIQLQGKTCSAWPEGIGARRVEVMEEHKIFLASAVPFRASSLSSLRRTASIGPGLVPCRGDEEALEQWSDDEMHDPTPRNGRVDPSDTSNAVDPPRPSFPARPRRVSEDNVHFQRNHFLHREALLPPVPPYSPPTCSTPASATGSDWHSFSNTSSSRDAHGREPDGSPSQALVDFRNAFLSGFESGQLSTSASLSHTPPTSPINIPRSSHSHTQQSSPMDASSSSSLQSYSRNSLSRQNSIEEVPDTLADDSNHRPSIETPSCQISTAVTTEGPKRFSFAAVSSALRDVVRHRARSRSPVGASVRDSTSSPDGTRNTERERGRTSNIRQSKQRQKDKFSIRNFGDFLKFEGDESQESGNGWKEFMPGTYTYPISFAIPGNSPPTLECEYGTVSWRLKAQVHRPGTFKAKLLATREVILIASPRENDAEDDNIIVERMWETQLQYLIFISGRRFPIGGTLPIHFTIVPLEKAMIYRITVWVEERIDYYTQMKRIARTEPVRRHLLLSLQSKSPDKDSDPILPLISDDIDAFKSSPFYSLLMPDDDPSEVASTLMGPGPWTFHCDLELPATCTRLHFTNRNRRSNIAITHMIKIVLRVRRGDDLVMDPKTGQRKLFDIVVQAPVDILSCRCNREWIALPRYTECFESNVSPTLDCPCVSRRKKDDKANLDDLDDRPQVGTYRRQSAGSTGDIRTANPLAFPPLQEASPFDRNTQFERLVSGQENEMGEMPPSYDCELFT